MVSDRSPGERVEGKTVLQVHDSNRDCSKYCCLGTHGSTWKPVERCGILCCAGLQHTAVMRSGECKFGLQTHLIKSCWAVLCHAMPCQDVLAYATPGLAVLHHAVLCRAVPCHAVLCHAMLRHALPCWVVPCFVMQCHVKNGMLCRVVSCLMCCALLCYQSNIPG